MTYVGVDVGARALHAVAVDGSLAVLDVAILDARHLQALVVWAEGATIAAIDAPDGPSAGAHAGDVGVAPKFRTGRCGEVALGRKRGYWVSWVTPVQPEPDSWIDVGIRAHAALQETIEVYPHAGFRELAGGATLPKKATVAGRLARAALLRAAGLRSGDLDRWSHDALDAGLAAVVALHHAQGRAQRVACSPDEACGQDGSAIWLPGGAHSSAVSTTRVGR
jgi:predicted nuclease with RNAse H fold